MNLIEQLGGYEKALQFFNSEKKPLEIDPVFYLDGQEILIDVLDDTLLQYRRQHNIFEVGDKVVLLNWDNNSRLLTIKKVHEHKLFKDGQHCHSTFIYLVEEWAWEQWFDKFQIRHATDSEIQAGRRLEVCGG